ncbi:ABC transporter ATP-binding protein [Flavihumibacter fluvii]|uniref:ABC transporter ATP-binding protein n=1 Tax=Flavihumibacter fluvii TaxID=2838157 RepID=UPI001BDF6AEF|nr:ABC transporter ATP-binding protein [Flavihumibacter fluvii]ULQ53432.1 ABC transporter ATP-binding protein [Flavihumibacter fluvii]
MELLRVSRIRKQGRDGFVLAEASFIQQKGQRIAIAGETGSGKTTLLKIIAGLIQPDSGEVLFEGEKVIGPMDKLIPGHPRIAYLSQHFELRNNYRVEEILSYANKITEESATKLYSVCRISHLLTRKTDQLSGGEKQRIAIARLLIGSPVLLVLDEPFSNLDLIHKQLLKSVLREIGNELDITCMLSSHDPQDTLSWADEIMVMHSGRIIQAGSPEEVYRKPVNEYVGGIFGNYTLIGQQLAAAYPSYFPDHPAGTSIFLRPEQLRIVAPEAEGFSATVQGIYFLGSSYEIELSLFDQVVLARSATGKFNVGEKVQVSLVPGESWYV